MNAFSARKDYLPDAGNATAIDHALGLQFCRAGMLSLTRLQLALERGDRRRAMEAIDQLHRFDIEVEQLVGRLSGPAPDARMVEIARYLREEKMELAFEKLALASGVSGPGLISRTAAIRDLPHEADATAYAAPLFAEPRGGGDLRGYILRAAAAIAAVGGVAAALFMAL
ncbi:hypothetical protein [Sphingomonas colocasiae]|uniref:Uncharacterized protein n=1 Tax=Sphingomonas colocasiae TaxID=1848973 RepID=A0ABS7PPB2_9SPHN|nr:hypothetical protein [Sphingomonas colocasiae]MBY8821864.1 hypothetical protein [Sphingomonas colocasiae]